jgi:hypothetical protein
MLGERDADTAARATPGDPRAALNPHVASRGKPFVS